MMVVIVLRLLPITVKNQNTVLSVIDTATSFIFIIDYLLRLITADKKLKKAGFHF